MGCSASPVIISKVFGPVVVKHAESQRRKKNSDAIKHLKFCKTLTQYTYAFIHQEAEFVREKHRKKSQKMIEKARKNYLKAVDAGLQAQKDGLQTPESLYWTAASLGLYIAVSKNDFQSIGRLNEVGDLAYQALELDANWNNGAIYELLCSFETSRADIIPGSLEKAEQLYQRALVLSDGKRASVFVTKAEGISIRRQDKEEFIDLLTKALDVPVPTNFTDRLADTVTKKRAKWLLRNIDEFFFE